MRKTLNEFEESIANAEYKDDIYEQRNVVAKIVDYYLQNKGPEIVQILEMDQGDGQILRNILFKIYDEVYFWGDVIVDGVIEASQLEHVVNTLLGEVVYSTQDNAPSTTASFFKLYQDKRFKLIEQLP